MSSAQNQPPRPPKSASTPKAQPDAQEKLNSELVPSAETDMDQYSDSTLSMTSSASPPPSEPMPSTPTQPDPPPAEPASPNAPATTADVASQQATIPRQQPIPPASEPMQYRAIGLTRGVYTPSDEQFTRGTILTQEGVSINAVLLGRVMSLVKKHLDLSEPHLWVVYPRTRANVDDLHLQIVGVWEPENLNRTSIQADEDLTDDESIDDELTDDELTDDESIDDELTAKSSETESDDTETEPSAALAEPTDSVEPTGVTATRPSASMDKPSNGSDETEPDDTYFSVRGEIIFQSIEQEQLLVKIQQAPRRPTDSPKAFKLALKGTVQGKAVGYFWDLHVQRQANTLVVQDGTMIAPVPPKKRQSKFGNRRRPGGGGGGRRPGPPNRRQGGERPTNISPQPSQPRREPLSKPIKRKDKESST